MSLDKITTGNRRMWQSLLINGAVFNILFISGLTPSPAGYRVLETQCQCTCPISKHLLQGVFAENEVEHTLQDDPLAIKDSRSETTTLSTTNNVYPTYAEPTTERPQSAAEVGLGTTNNARPTYAEPITEGLHQATEEGSGADDEEFTTNYYVDSSEGDDELPSVDITRHRTRAKIIANPDDEQLIGQPMAAKAPKQVIAGPKGQKGEAGIQGTAGYDGEPGTPGVPGESGEDGVPGEAGIKGDKGDKGDKGPRGYPGSVGLQGYRGAPGPFGETGRPGPRGGDGVRGSRGEQGVMGRRGLAGEPGLKGEPGEPGTPGKDAPEMTTTQNKVDINLGSGFDASSGSFLAPVDGVYILHLQVMAMADHIAWLALQVNGEPVAYAWASGYTSAVEQMGTTMTIQQLKRGDVANVIQKASENPSNYLYAHYTLFSGYLIG